MGGEQLNNHPHTGLLYCTYHSQQIVSVNKIIAFVKIIDMKLKFSKLFCLEVEKYYLMVMTIKPR